MIRPSSDSEVYLYHHAVDMRKGAHGLMAIVEGKMQLDPFSSKLFIFCNNACTIIKAVAWNDNDFILLVKRIEKARFKCPLLKCIKNYLVL